MFPLHDQTRRQICLLAFLACCVLPTIAIAGWSCLRCSSWHRSAEEQRLSRELGLDVSIAALSHPLPGVTRYEGLTLTDAETAVEVLRCTNVDASWTTMTDSHGQERPAVVLEAGEMVCNTSAAERLRRVLARRLECQLGRPEVEVRLKAAQCTLRNSRESFTLQQVEGGIGLMPAGIQAQLVFHLPGGKDAVRMRIVRNRQVSPPANSFEMDTGSNAIPCRLLTIGAKDLQLLGENCCFSGYVLSYETPDGPTGEATGQLRSIDLERFVGRTLAHRISGTADVTLHRAKFQHGRLDELVGRIVVGPGTLGRAMADALTTHLQLRPGGSALSGDSLPFERLAAEFWLDNRGITIAGRCAEVPGAVAIARGQAVLGEPTGPRPVAAVIQALAPAGSLSLPANRQAGWLARLLPVPEGTPAAMR